MVGLLNRHTGAFEQTYPAEYYHLLILQVLALHQSVAQRLLLSVRKFL
ncbi:conserved hypothetical protein [Acidithiobacillus caldus SM-1]|uniref:Uncharacterized protein n=2 Tax=Acidithiobacillus caldus TaxID=33059 RepID=F9ZSW4_ACICS|nr:conserved hypothetical protein [Acidithiobacillus caldus SM-1]AIA54362.1 hypothetical protein Acaty_c0474 [Acidithiobacillus caldus ATCC 51756]QER43269.1 hypothetical protein F0726_00179 [Acidithiobacillus caldus]